MSVADVERAVRLAIVNARAHAPWFVGNETAVRYALVDPILWALGWSTWLPSQCRPDFKLGTRGLADYALLDPEDIAHPVHYWLRQGLWWNWSG